MDTLFISLLTLALLLISGFLILIVLMQRTSQSGGMGAALGGGAAESAFGSETNSILMKGTIYGIVAFFLVALGLYLFYQSAASEQTREVDIETLVTAGQADDASGTVNEGEALKNNGTDGTVTDESGSVSLQAEAEATAEPTKVEAEQAAEAIEAEAADALPATN